MAIDGFRGPTPGNGRSFWTQANTSANGSQPQVRTPKKDYKISINPVKNDTIVNRKIDLPPGRTFNA